MTYRKKQMTSGGEVEPSAAFPAEAGDGAKDRKHYYTYVLRCADGTYYTGWTTDLKKRLAAHNRGTGSRYTRARRPVELVFWKESASREEAMSREWHWKRLRREEKERMIAAGIPPQNGGPETDGPGASAGGIT